MQARDDRLGLFVEDPFGALTYCNGGEDEIVLRFAFRIGNLQDQRVRFGGHPGRRDGDHIKDANGLDRLRLPAKPASRAQILRQDGRQRSGASSLKERRSRLRYREGREAGFGLT